MNLYNILLNLSLLEAISMFYSVFLFHFFSFQSLYNELLWMIAVLVFQESEKLSPCLPLVIFAAIGADVFTAFFEIRCQCNLFYV